MSVPEPIRIDALKDANSSALYWNSKKNLTPLQKEKLEESRNSTMLRILYNFIREWKSSDSRSQMTKVVDDIIEYNEDGTERREEFVRYVGPPRTTQQPDLQQLLNDLMQNFAGEKFTIKILVKI
jgi:hypothetical protein